MRGGRIQIPLIAIIGPPAKGHLNGVSLACWWWPNIECWLSSFVIFLGIWTRIAKKPDIFVIFQGGGVRTPGPPFASPHDAAGQKDKNWGGVLYVKIFNMIRIHLKSYATQDPKNFFIEIVLPFVDRKPQNGKFEKQWRRRWNAARCSISSGSALFAKKKSTFRENWKHLNFGKQWSPGWKAALFYKNKINLWKNPKPMNGNFGKQWRPRWNGQSWLNCTKIYGNIYWSK